MDNKNFTIYKSSAGSGKTFTLVKEYLALALSDESIPPRAYKHILAITFTNKAASEMKERIIKSLKELAEDDYSTLSGGVKTLLGALKKHPRFNSNQAATDILIRSRANAVLKEILHNYSDFGIGTIDSFVHKVVKAFAFDLKIPLNFELEMDEDKLLTIAIDLLLSQIGSNELLTKALIEYASSKTDDEKSWHIENDLKYFAKNLLNEDGTIYIDRLKELSIEDFFEIKDALQQEIKLFENEITRIGKTGIKEIKSAGIEPETFAGGANGINKYFSYLAELRYDKLKPSNTVKKNIDSDKWYASKANADEKSKIDSIKYKLTQLFNEVVNYIDKKESDFIVFRAINNTIYSLAVLNEIERLLNEYKAQNNILHISEFNKLIAKIVLTEPTPFIYERIGDRYNNYLIDEFQDTSVLQFQNLLPLIDNALAQGNFTMLVGDGKQAIYRWRGGEVEQFALLPKLFSTENNYLLVEREQALIRNHNPQRLNQNYRSKREIIEFNNSLFNTLALKISDKYRGIYDAQEQGFIPTNTGGYVQVEFLQGEKEELVEQNLESTYNVIKQLIEQNYNLSDIAILVRKNSNASLVASHLAERGIEVISSEALLLKNSSEVEFIFAVLKYLNNKNDAIIQTELIQYFSKHESVFNIPDTSFNELLSNHKNNLTVFIKKLYNNFNYIELSKMALYELCEELVRIFKLNASPNAYIQFFLDEVLNFSIKQNNNLKDFIDYWEDKKENSSLIVPQGINAVTIMTVHRSKGLEFPVVIFPFANEKVTPSKKHLWINVEHEAIPTLPVALVATNEKLLETEYAYLYEEEKNKSLLDAINLLYVALTRPEERLYVFTSKPSKNTDSVNSYSDMFAYYYQSCGQWDTNKTIYTHGEEKTKKQHAKSEITNTFNLKSFNSHQWRESIKMRAAAPSIWNLEIVDNKKNYGVLVHTALAKIKTKNDIENSLESMLASGLISIKEKENLFLAISKIISLPLLQNHFKLGLNVKNESEIIAISGERFRLDRVILNSDYTAIIIDYKTGQEKNEHKKQIAQYAELLNQMGYSVTEKLLVYIENEKIIKV
ncbi:MAG: UvrD-helicase domain-containing protein [Bacteroidia bacterium]